MSFSWQLEDENVVPLHYGRLFSRKGKNGIMNLAGKEIELQKIILGEVTQTQKDKHHKLSSHLWFPTPRLQM